MASPDKVAAVAELSERFTQANGAVLTEYRGLSVAQLKELRSALGDNATYAVVKNTLTKIAANDAGITALDDLLVGPSAVAFVTGDVVEAAKGLRDFARVNQPLVIKGGVIDGAPVSADELRQMADLESREVLLARLAGALQASLAGAASLFNAPLAQVARVLGALQAQQAEQASQGQGDDPAPQVEEQAPQVEEQAPQGEDEDEAADADADADASPTN